MSALILSTRDELPVAVACAALDLSRATLYRPVVLHKETRPRAALFVPRKLTDKERAAILEVLHSEEFIDQPPREIVSVLLRRGIYLGSVRTYYRVLAQEEETRERRNQRRHPKYVTPSLTARAPNEVWTWDITKLAGPLPGVFYYAYVILDLFSRFVVGWTVAEHENANIATRLIRRTLKKRVCAGFRGPE